MGWHYYTNGSQTVSPAVETDSIEIVEVEEPNIPVVPKIVTDIEFSVGNAIYTGQIETIEGNNEPHGKGVTRFGIDDHEISPQTEIDE